jgi:hypothetical protein
MTRRTRLLGLLVLVGLAELLAIGAFVVLTDPDQSTIMLGHYCRIKMGMSRDEVETILGPPGDYTTGPVWWPEGMVGHRELGDFHIESEGSGDESFPPPEGISEWIRDAARIRVNYGLKGVCFKKFQPAGPKKSAAPKRGIRND